MDNQIAPELSSKYHAKLLQVALAVPVGDFFDYLCPIHLTLPSVGTRVQVPFGSRHLIGVVVGIIDIQDSQVPINKLKPILKQLDQTPILDDQLLKLARWLAKYYHHPLGDVLSVMLPTLIMQGKPINRTHTLWQLKQQPFDEILARSSKTAKKQQQLLQTLNSQPNGLTQNQLTALGFHQATLNAAYKLDLIYPTTRTPIIRPVQCISTPLQANAQQQFAIDKISNATQKKQYQGFLLNGITGSGKTEVYLQTMQSVLEQGRQVLILVPEIGLTPQTKTRFSSRFDANICVLHSKMNDTERLQGWADCKNGTAQIVIGTRSSILYPFLRLGLIIIDESHDTSYKQQDHLRYHACDVAMMRAFFEKIPILLGTATPSLEHYKLIDDGKLTELPLTQRAGKALPAKFHLIDARIEPQQALLKDGQNSDTAFSQQTIRAIRQRLSAGEQVLVFLNRRGYAPILLCHACGWQADCPNCDAHLTVHHLPFSQTLRCHHCNHQTGTPPHCPNCHSLNLSTLGIGTSQLAAQLHALFANPQNNHHTYPIIQIDRDTMQKKGMWEKTLDFIHRGEPAILVGTQMIAKGHHFANVTLVVIAQADLGFLSPDFRSPEHTAQRIIQVAGRAGRAEKLGNVYLQTLQPNNPFLRQLVEDGYAAFAKKLLAERKMMGLPPYSYAALIRAESVRYDRAKQAIITLKNKLPASHGFAVLAPIDAPMHKKNNRYFVQMLLLSRQRQALHAFLGDWWQMAICLPESKAVRLSLDIDPLGW